MEIHEITKISKNNLDEGILDGIKQTTQSAASAIKHPVQAVKALASSDKGSLGSQIQTQQQNALVNKYAGKFYSTWLNYRNQKDQTFDTTQEKQEYYNNGGYQEDLKKFIEKNLYRGGAIDDPKVENLINQLVHNAQAEEAQQGLTEAPNWDQEKQAVKKDIDTTVDKLKPLGQKAKQVAQSGWNKTKNVASNVATGAQNVYNNPYTKGVKPVATALGKGIKTAASGMAQGAKAMTSKKGQQDQILFQKIIKLAMLSATIGKKDDAGGKVISKPGDPVIIRYRNHDYVIGDAGRWVNSQTKKEAPESLEAYFDKIQERYELHQYNNSQQKRPIRNRDPSTLGSKTVKHTGNKQADMVLMKNGFKVT